MLCKDHTPGRRGQDRSRGWGGGQEGGWAGGATLISGPWGGSFVCSDPSDHLAHRQGLGQHCTQGERPDPLLQKQTLPVPEEPASLAAPEALRERAQVQNRTYTYF